MLRRVAQFLFLDHIKATLWASAAVVLVSIIYGLVVYPQLPTRLVYAVLNVVLAILGVVAFLTLILGIRIYAGRKKDDSI